MHFWVCILLRMLVVAALFFSAAVSLSSDVTNTRQFAISKQIKQVTKIKK